MTVQTLHETIELTVINCGECGGSYAINERYRLQKWQTGGSWNCPYCQVGWGYSNDNELQRVKKELERRTKEKEWAIQAKVRAEESLTHALHRERAQKAAKTKIKKRVTKGVCPCCNRFFPEDRMAKHLQIKHPDFVNTD